MAIDDYDGHEDDLQRQAAERRHAARCEAWDDLPTVEKQRLIAVDVTEQRARRNADEAARRQEQAEIEREEAERVKREHARWRGDR